MGKEKGKKIGSFSQSHLRLLSAERQLRPLAGELHDDEGLPASSLAGDEGRLIPGATILTGRPAGLPRREEAAEFGDRENVQEPLLVQSVRASDS